MKRIFPASLSFLLMLSACVMPFSSGIQSSVTQVPTSIVEEPAMTFTVPSTDEPVLNSIPLRCGINFGNMLESPNEGEWGLMVQEDYFDRVKEAGFDFVRLPVSWSTHADQGWPYTLDQTFLARVDEVINWGLERDLTMIVDFHHMMR